MHESTSHLLLELSPQYLIKCSTVKVFDIGYYAVTFSGSMNFFSPKDRYMLNMELAGC